MFTTATGNKSRSIDKSGQNRLENSHLAISETLCTTSARSANKKSVGTPDWLKSVLNNHYGKTVNSN